jgi:hypothetical protein
MCPNSRIDFSKKDMGHMYQKYNLPPPKNFKITIIKYVDTVLMKACVQWLGWTLW